MFRLNMRPLTVADSIAEIHVEALEWRGNIAKPSDLSCFTCSGAGS